MTPRVVRRLSAGVTHVTDVTDTDIVVMTWIKPFLAVPLPVITVCGAKLAGQAAICTDAGTKVTCARCRRLTGIGNAPVDNHLLLGRTAADLWGDR